MIQTSLWSSQDAVRATHGESAERWSAEGVSIDSRTILQGELFVALRGPDHDGHDYVADAFDGGSTAGTSLY